MVDTRQSRLKIAESALDVDRQVQARMMGVADQRSPRCAACGTRATFTPPRPSSRA